MKENNINKTEFVPAPEGFLYAKVDENHKLTIINQVEAYNQGLPLIEWEQAYDDCLYERGYAPEKPIEMKQEEVRTTRNKYLETYVDPVVTNPLRWEELSKKEQQVYKDYRRYLLDYTEIENWWEQEPLTLDEWKDK